MSMETSELDIESRFENHTESWPGSIQVLLGEVKAHEAYLRDFVAHKQGAYTPEMIADSLHAVALHAGR